jgi:hypothetical protein
MDSIGGPLSAPAAPHSVLVSPSSSHPIAS